MKSAGAARYKVESLARQHDRDRFECGIDSLDQYLKTQASQDMRRKANAVFVLVPEDDPGSICGYFTLCSYGLAPGAIPDEARKHIPRYPVVSATLLGRLAIRRDLQGRGLGSILLAEALRKAYENAAVVGSSMVVVDALDEGAARFYAAYGFTRLSDSMRLILPMHTIGKLMDHPQHSA
ncbi:MAG TPA: GNAT family N-acetyltransferase [Terracidiphilus sp.]|jgi:GNAT superfamily N-acetyltransferase|nr:GNAT family N-acetyltransferase [Terracidiphilus sp.]